MKRYSIKVVGNSGMGLLTVGEIVMKSLKRMGFHISADREYPSLIKGGFSSSQIDFSTSRIRSLSTKVDILIALEKDNLLKYLPTVKKGGIVIHGYERHRLMPHLPILAKKQGIKLIYAPAREIAYKLGGNDLVTNMVLLGVLWRVCGFDIKFLNAEVEKEFANKPKFLEIDLKCIAAGYKEDDITVTPPSKEVPNINLKEQTSKKLDKSAESSAKTILIDGSEALSLGAIHAGVRVYYAYPMSPSSGILKYFAATSHDTKIVVKQAEDEITAVQMAIGSMYAGARALVATSGGGFDLMTESLSLAGIIENPLVIVIAQRPGPGTGLPTWTAQGDLNMAIHSGHGEFTRMVIGCSDQESSFELIQQALNYAEVFQIPVIVLTEKVVVEAKTTVKSFKQNTIPIKRGIVTDKQELEDIKSSDRYKITESGLSKRWLPGSSKTIFFANGDEHWESGEITEEADLAKQMYEKRIRKEKLIIKEMPDPIVHGSEKADISFVGWGSVKNAVLDAMEELKEEGIKVNYLHYDYLWPLKTEAADKFFKENKNLHLIENNYHGQLGQLIEDKTKNKFNGKFLKWDGRAFFFDEVVEYVKENL